MLKRVDFFKVIISCTREEISYRIVKYNDKIKDVKWHGPKGRVKSTSTLESA